MQQAKLFLGYVDDIVRTVKDDPEKVLRAANLLHPNLQFTIETPNTNGKQAFLDLQICNSRLLTSHMRLKKNRPYNHWLKIQGRYLLCFSTSNGRSQFGSLAT